MKNFRMSDVKGTKESKVQPSNDPKHQIMTCQLFRELASYPKKSFCRQSSPSILF